MYKILRFIICYAIAFLALYISGYVNLMNDISESLAVTTFFLTALVLGVIAFLMLEMYLGFKTKVEKLNARITTLEEKIQSAERQN